MWKELFLQNTSELILLLFNLSLFSFPLFNFYFYLSLKWKRHIYVTERQFLKVQMAANSINVNFLGGRQPNWRLHLIGLTTTFCCCYFSSLLSRCALIIDFWKWMSSSLIASQVQDSFLENARLLKWDNITSEQRSRLEWRKKKKYLKIKNQLASSSTEIFSEVLVNHT